MWRCIIPRIELIPDVYYQPNDPYHWEIDNLPLKNIVRRQDLINLALDDVLEQMRDAIGTQGSVANRLNQSIAADGGLKSTAIDDALHSIESHTDTANYVRMTKAQSDKLDLIASNATDLKLEVSEDGVAYVEFDSGSLKIAPSTTVTPNLTSNILKFDLAFPTSAAHQHHYGLTPVHVNSTTPDYINYKVNSSATPFVSGSLRVYVNGVRIFEGDEVYVPGALVTDAWTLMSFTPNHSAGTFALSTAASSTDLVKIDFDISLV